jgi:hypothetical protein
MRYVIKQVTVSGELWLVRATKKKTGVWGARERAYGFFRRPTAERWIAKLGSTGGLTLEIVETTVSPPVAVALDAAPAPDEIEVEALSAIQFALA